MHVVSLEVEVRIPAAQSLKAKRSVLQSIVRTLDGWKAVGAAEVGLQDKWQRARIGVVVVSGTAPHAQEVVESVERYVWSRPDVEVVAIDQAWALEPGG